MTILDKLADHARERVAERRISVPLKTLQAQAISMSRGDFRFERVLQRDGISFICECKKASPSKGVIAENYPYLDIAKAYEKAGADCISVLTEPRWFLGSTDHLRKISSAVSIPVIRKDFTVDPYMIYEAKVCGASAVLLICSILEREEIAEYLAICDDLGLSALVEAHDEREIETALSVSARIIGVNNRNLKNFTMDFSNSANLRSLVPDDVVFVSESGVKGREDVERLERIGVNAVLVGETLMRARDKTSMLHELRYGK